MRSLVPYTTRNCTCDQEVDSAGGVAPDLGPRGLVVYLWVGGALELLQHEGALRARHDLLRLIDRPLHALQHRRAATTQWRLVVLLSHHRRLFSLHSLGMHICVLRRSSPLTQECPGHLTTAHCNSCVHVLHVSHCCLAVAHQAPLCQDELRAEGLEQDAALGAHGVRHRQYELVALRRCDVRQAHARVAAGGLHLQRVMLSA